MMHSAEAPRRQLGNSNLWVSPVGFGCWPLAGITSVVDSDAESIRTIHAALDAGINFFDTAYSYGYDGRSDDVLRQALRSRRGEVVIASKVGMHWGPDRKRVLDARPTTLLKHAQEVLERLDVENVDLMYLHAPDEQTPIEQSAEAILEIVQKGWARYAAVSNVTAEQAERFHRVCPIVAIQPQFNMLQQESVIALREFCRRHQCGLVCYWVLMKGLLSGKLQRDHQFDPRDRRLTYELFRGETWQRNQDFLDRLRAFADSMQLTVSQLVIAWTLAQDDISVALCGAKHPEQIVDNAQGMHVELTPTMLAEIDGYIAQRGPVE